MDFKTAQQEAISGWFSEGDCRIKVKSPEEEDLRAVDDEYTEIKHEFAHNPVTGKLERVEWREEIGDPATRSLALGARLIVEWENVEIDGEPAECTQENKMKLLGQSKEFREFYAKAVEGITKQVKKDFGSEKPSKNSKSTQRKK